MSDQQLEILYKAACKVFSGCLSSTPIPLLLIETHLPLLKITLKHQAFSCFGRALHLLQELFILKHSWLKISDQPVKEETLCGIILLIHKRNPSILVRTINYVSPNPHWTPIKFTISSFICNCIGPSLSQLLEYAKILLLSLPPPDAYAWTDESVPSLIRLAVLECMQKKCMQ